MPIPPVRSDWVPDACSLPSIDRPLRIAEFDQFFAGGVRLLRRPAPARLELLLTDEAEPVGRDLAARESTCCSLFTFDFAVTTDGVVMGVEVPGSSVDVLDVFAVRARIAIGVRA